MNAGPQNIKKHFVVVDTLLRDCRHRGRCFLTAVASNELSSTNQTRQHLS